MFANVKEWIENNWNNLSLMLCVLAALLVVYSLLFNINELVPTLPNEVENFVVPSDDITKLNSALTSIISCRTDKCGSDKIINYQDVKIKLWPDFNVLLFHDLLVKRETTKAPLSDKDVNDIVSSNPKYADSFVKKAVSTNTNIN